MQNELYSFDTVGPYNIAVEHLDDGTVSGVAYVSHPHDPTFYKDGENGEAVRFYLMEKCEHMKP